MSDPAHTSEVIPVTRDAALAHLAVLGVHGEHERLQRAALATLQHLVPCHRAELLTNDHGGWSVASGTEADRVGRSVTAGWHTRLDALPPDVVRPCTDPLGDGSACLVLRLPGEDDDRVLLCVDDGRRAEGGEDLLRSVAAILSLSGARRRAEAERDGAETRFERFAEHSTDAFFRLRLRPTERVEYLSPRFAELTGLSREELGASIEAWRALVPPEDLGALPPPGELPEDSVRTEPYRIVHRDGAATWVETVFIAERDHDGHIAVISGATRDVTADRASNEALQRALEHERRATEELREISTTKDALLSAISHELRTPLTVLRGFAELLLTHGDSLPPSNRDAAVVALERNAQRLDELLTSILDLDRLSRGAMMLTVRELPVSPLVAEVIDAMELDGRDIRLEVDDLVIH
ncbi:MAG: histidine kinase dimerization/phospho-acceptor domain-containing protein, partial [Nitriliruptoraceae bacterium]